MTPGRGRRSLGERAAASGIRADVPPAGQAPSEARSDAPSATPSHAVADAVAGEGGGEGWHCWVRDPPDVPGVWPGLLVEWRQRDGHWQGRVAYTVAGPHGPALVETWIPAALLEPR